jgi:hypothetical protein
MVTPRIRRRTIRALFPFVTGALVLACGNAEPPADTFSPPPPASPTLQGHHFYVLDAVARSDDTVNCPNAVATLHLGLDLDIQDIAAQGWMSLDGVEGTQAAFEVSSASMAGIVDGGLASFDGFHFVSGEDVLFFTTFALVTAKGGNLVGVGSGGWTTNDPSQQCMASFTASITSAPDVAPPGATLTVPDPALHLPFESIDVRFDEPVALVKTTFEVRAGDLPVPAKLLPAPGRRPGFADRLAIAPVTSFPAGQSLSIAFSLADAAGNAGDVLLGPLTIAPKGEAGKNLGFEGGLQGWLSDPPWSPDPAASSLVSAQPTYPVYGVDGSKLDVTPVEGSLLAAVRDGGRLVGYLVPPPGKTHLRLSAAVAHVPAFELDQLGTGILIQVFAEGAPVVKQDGKALLPIADPLVTWTGWGSITVDLPEEAAAGFWLQVEPFVFPKVGGATNVLLDDLSFE